MLPDSITVLLLLGACAGAFLVNKPRADVVALLAIVLLPLLGLTTVNEALAGFSDPNVILVAVLFVVGEGLSRTGVTYYVGEMLLRSSGKSPGRLLVFLMGAVGALGAFMSSTGIVAVFVPIVLRVCGRMNISPGRLMMPLSVAGLVSGMLTLVATAPNLVINGALTQAGHSGFTLFSFTPIGSIVLCVSIAYMLIVAPRVARSEALHSPAVGRSLDNIIEEYRLGDRARSFLVELESRLVGQPLRTVNLREEYGVNIVAIQRWRMFRKELLNPDPSFEIRSGDVLLVDLQGSLSQRERLLQETGLSELPLRNDALFDQNHDVGIVEVMLPPTSSLIDSTIVKAGFRRKYHLTVLGVRRQRRALEGSILHERLEPGDILLIVGSWKAIHRLQAKVRDFVVLTLPAGVEEAAPAASQAPFALLSLAIMVFLMTTGAVPNVIAALIGALIMGLFRCIGMDHAYKSVQWSSIVLIVGMMPFAVALQKTGVVDLVAGTVMQWFDGAGPRTLLAAVFVVTSLIGLFISNTATAVLMAPVALAMAQKAGASPYPFAMTVALASSAAFMTPVSSPVNTLVYAAGGYKFSDFVRVGVPLTLIVLVVTVMLVPVFFPL